MAIQQDPERNETRALFDLADFNDKKVLEIGCGNGRLTWRFADRAAHVTAIDEWSEGIEQAREDLPKELIGRVEFHDIAFEDLAATSPSSVYDIVLLSWSLC